MPLARGIYLTHTKTVDYVRAAGCLDSWVVIHLLTEKKRGKSYYFALSEVQMVLSRQGYKRFPDIRLYLSRSQRCRRKALI